VGLAYPRRASRGDPQGGWTTQTYHGKEELMSVRKLIPVAGLVFALAALAPAWALAKKGGTDRPIKGTVSGAATTTPTSETTGDYFQESAGVASHVGKYTREVVGTYEVTGTEPGFVFIHGEGEFTVVAANGDELDGYFEFDGVVDLSTGIRTSTVQAEFQGGTGRFADASGEATEEDVITPTETPGEGHITGTFKGHVSY
jgi:hypothetical protein